MPSILIETGFLTNPKEEDYLNSNEGKIYLASAIFRAFRSYKESIERSSEQISKKQDKSQLKREEKKQLKVEEGVEREELRIEVKSNIVFKVQIGTYLKEMKRSKKFQGLEVEQQNINGTYKYLVGNTTSKKVADKLRIKMVERGFNGAFIIALKDGVRINVKEALSLQNK
jgi:N-acetylmuramoyl-L-alanine amidase